MSDVLLLPAPARKDSLEEIVANSSGLSIITDLDPDTDLVSVHDDLTGLAASGDCILQLPAGKRNLNVIGGPHLVNKLDNGGAIEELLEKLAKPTIEPPKKGRFTKEFLFNVLANHCNMIVDERIIHVTKPMQRYHSSLPDPVQLQVFLKELLEEAGTASSSTLRKQITLRKCKGLYNICITDHRAIAKAKTFINDGNYIAVANGIIHVVGGKIFLLKYEEHPELSFKHMINANYDPQAKHVVWDAFLSDFIGHKQKDLDRFWESEGDLHFPNQAAKSIKGIYGKGNDGKTVLTGFHLDIYTPDAVFDGDLGQALSQFGTEAFKDAQILQLHEMNTVISINQSNKIKRITGGDRLMLDKKFFNLVSRLIKTKIVVTCNHLPRFAIGAVDQALEDRFQFIKVSAAPKEFRTETLRADLFKERDYYLTQAVQGYARLQANHYQFTKSKKDSELKKLVFANNPAKAFLQDCCVTEDVGPDDYILGTDWKMVVDHWKVDIFEKFNYVTLKNALVNLGYPYTKLTKGPDRNRYAFKGLRLNEFSLKIVNKYRTGKEE